MKSMVVVLLSGISTPLFDVSRPCIEAAGAVGAWDNLPVALVSVLSNALLRRIQDPTVIELQGSKQVSVASIMLVDAAFNAFMDLHATDDSSVLTVFTKLDCINILVSSHKKFAAQVFNMMYTVQ